MLASIFTYLFHGSYSPSPVLSRTKCKLRFGLSLSPSINAEHFSVHPNLSLLSPLASRLSRATHASEKGCPVRVREYHALWRRTIWLCRSLGMPLIVHTQLGQVEPTLDVAHVERQNIGSPLICLDYRSWRVEWCHSYVTMISILLRPSRHHLRNKHHKFRWNSIGNLI